MPQAIVRSTACLLAIIACLSGCAMRQSEIEFAAADQNHFQHYAKEIEYPDVQCSASLDVASTPAPLTLRDSELPPFVDVDLEEAIRQALTNAEVLRDLEGMVLMSPDNIPTTQDPALRETDPIVGIEAALSEFDVMLESNAYFERNDRALNNVFFGGGTRLLEQDLHKYSTQLSKRAATGTDFTLRHNIAYDYNNSPGNDKPNRPWDVNFEAELRQPLWQGAGVEFNRIAGPNATPGRANGVLLARLNSDVSLAEFEIGVRDLVASVEKAYWELYYAYRDLDIKIRIRDRALERWRLYRSWEVSKRLGGEAQREALAREQYLRAQRDVENALSGVPPEKTRFKRFRGYGGVYTLERQLRLIMGIPLNDGHLLRPVTEPTKAEMVFDWSEALFEALARRPELRRQQWIIKHRELELVAANNFLKPRLDAIGRYRWRGLGSDLINSDGGSGDRFDNAYGTLTEGDFQEWQLGIELSAPLGFRQAHAGVRHAQLRLARERAILEEQQRQVVYDLSNAYAELERAYVVSQTNYNRFQAAQTQLKALLAIEPQNQNERISLTDQILEAQRRNGEAESDYFLALLEYNQSIRDLHLEKGSLLDYSEVYLVEGAWPGKAYVDAARREQRRGRPHEVGDYRMARAPLVSQGVYPQDTMAVGSPSAMPTPLPPIDDLEPAVAAPDSDL